MELPNKKYKLVYADPPWEYSQKKVGRGYKHGAEQKYNLLSIEDIKNLGITKITKENSVLFLWVTVPLLPYGFEVIKSWGFEYKTSLYWNKKNSLGLGNWFRNNVEQCLIGIRGNVKAFNLQIPNIIEVHPNGHSKKPKCMYPILESLDLDPKIELFARDHREGWDVYGDELNNTMQRLIT